MRASNPPPLSTSARVPRDSSVGIERSRPRDLRNAGLSHTDRKKYLRGNTSQDFRSLKDFGSLSIAVFIWDPYQVWLESCCFAICEGRFVTRRRSKSEPGGRGSRRAIFSDSLALRRVHSQSRRWTRSACPAALKTLSVRSNAAAWAPTRVRCFGANRPSASGMSRTFRTPKK